MAKESKKQKKIPFSEEDAAALLEKYDAITVFTLLQELSNYPYPKFDWNELVAKTSTGISDVEEYRMLWHLLAYGQNFEDTAQPLGDDSDLECEREVSPPVSKETVAEAAACVQVMITSFQLSESTPTSSVIQAPLTINVPVRHSTRIPNESSQPSDSMMQASIIFPVTVKRQALPNTSSAGAMKTNRSVSDNKSTKKKRAPWSEEEDKQLREAVQMWGEGNWAEKAKRDDFPIKRSTSQLSKRWNTLRKKDGGTN
ncbi:hypothetical protein VNO77_31764 [Canavalia gladiata]|uniref:Uncharacterized protein n=1 Tax=Canavalia gladiata TaxID=3824 RepID=A0AAN9KSQ6_CANGL